MLGETKRRAEQQNTRRIGVCKGTEMSRKPLMMLRPRHHPSFSSLQLSNTFPFLWYKGESFILREEVQTGSKGGHSVVLLPLLSSNSLPLLHCQKDRKQNKILECSEERLRICRGQRKRMGRKRNWWCTYEDGRGDQTRSVWVAEKVQEGGKGHFSERRIGTGRSYKNVN